MSTASLRLAQVTGDNLDAACAISVRADQQHLVSPVVKSLAEAYVHPTAAWPRLVLDGDRAVGFVMAFFDVAWDDDPHDVRSGLWRLNIAAAEQGKGYGRFAVLAVAQEVRRRGAKHAYVTYHPGPDGPEGFYAGLGFRRTGESSGGQAVAALAL
ncbi:acetyltransferase [Streptomyces sp. CB00455]|uniref:GNAT family N-acetyltransferase n=1 Tax=Streptomyces sp. CB00455 TaxID=1703927 RepID=UPI00093C3B6F|nr:GNAT family N-acetyltransferase [Streptomyces sp. CB00455]OKK14695.1 acetyltransferase [Streptomyces sp. CB00455]